MAKIYIVKKHIICHNFSCMFTKMETEFLIFACSNHNPLMKKDMKNDYTLLENTLWQILAVLAIFQFLAHMTLKPDKRTENFEYISTYVSTYILSTNLGK